METGDKEGGGGTCVPRDEVESRTERSWSGLEGDVCFEE